MELSRCINFLLNAAQHTVFQHFSEQLAAHDITPAQYGVLNCLWSNHCLTPKQIGELLYLEASSVSTLLDRMQKNGLVERNIDPENRRTILVSPTQKALDLQVPVTQVVDSLNQQIMGSFPAEERETTLRVLLAIAKKKSL